MVRRATNLGIPFKMDGNPELSPPCLLPAFYFLPLSGNKTKQPLAGKKSLTDIRRLRRYRRFLAVELSRVFLPISPSFRVHSRARRTDSFSPLLLTSVFVALPPTSRRRARHLGGYICPCFKLGVITWSPFYGVAFSTNHYITHGWGGSSGLVSTPLCVFWIFFGPLTGMVLLI